MANIDQEFSDGSVRWIVRDTKSPANSSNAGLMSATDKAKLDGYPVKGTDTTKFLRNDGQWAVPPTYTLTKATTSSLGGVMIGNNISVDSNGKIGVSLSGNANQYLSGNGQWAVPPNTTYTLTKATTSSLGGVMIGNNISVDSNGKIGVSLSGNANQYLSGNGQWTVPPNTTYDVVNTSNNGLAPKLPTLDASARFLRGDGRWESPPGFTLDKKYDQVVLPKQTGYLQYEMKSQYMRPSWTGYDSHKLQISQVRGGVYTDANDIPASLRSDTTIRVDNTTIVGSLASYLQHSLGGGNITAGKQKILDILHADNWSDVRYNSVCISRMAGLHVVKFKPINGYKWSPVTLFNHGIIQTSLATDSAYEANSTIPLMTHWVVHKRNLQFDLIPRQTVSISKPLVIYYDTEDTDVYNNSGQTIPAASTTNTVEGTDVEDTIKTYDIETVSEDIDENGNTLSSVIRYTDKEDSKKLFLFKNSEAGSSITPEQITISGGTASIGKYIHFRNDKNFFSSSAPEYVDSTYLGKQTNEKYIKIWCRNAQGSPIQVLSIGQPQTKGYHKNAREMVIQCVKEEGQLEFTDTNKDYNEFTITNATNEYSIPITYTYDCPLTVYQPGITPSETKTGITITPANALSFTVNSETNYTHRFIDSTGESIRTYNDFTFKFKPNMSSGKFTVKFDVPANSKLYTKPYKLILTGYVDVSASKEIFNTETSEATLIADKVTRLQQGDESSFNVGDYIRFKFHNAVPLQKWDEENADNIKINTNTYYRAVLIGLNHFAKTTMWDNVTPVINANVLNTGNTGKKGAHFAICRDDDNNDIAFSAMSMNRYFIYKSGRTKETHWHQAYFNASVSSDSSNLIPNSDFGMEATSDYPYPTLSGVTADNFKRKEKDQFGQSNGGWYLSHLRYWLNGQFYNALPDAIKNNCKKATIPSSNYLITDETTRSSINTVVGDKIWIPNAKEFTGTSWSASKMDSTEVNSSVRYEYFLNGNFINKYKHDDITATTNVWTRTQHLTNKNNMFYVRGTNNAIDNNQGTVRYGIVPCFII